MRAVAPILMGLGLLLAAGPAAATAAEGSRCIAVAKGPSPTIAVNYVPSALESEQVRITYVTHSTFRIETPGGTIIATDYAGVSGNGPLPTVVTMNHAHATHFTYFPDPGIKHVLRGWNPEGGPAQHLLKVGDVLIRNVPTDIRDWDGGREKDGNSIFIFEVAGLCIGHLGHLHHELSPEDLGQIGQLDIVMAPVDGTFTLELESMVKTLSVLKARVVIPMHAFSEYSLSMFVQAMSPEFAVVYSDASTLIASVANLPPTPTVIVLPETTSWSWD